jgi:putative DeoR family transcriptional regulator (stage III sporulation protein D)
MHIAVFFIIRFFSSAHLGGIRMTETIAQRTQELAMFMIETGATVRKTAKHFGISKSTVHKDLSQRLPSYNQHLYQQVRDILENNKAQRHIRGGMATKKKFEQIKSSK